MGSEVHDASVLASLCRCGRTRRDITLETGRAALQLGICTACPCVDTKSWSRGVPKLVHSSTNYPEPQQSNVPAWMHRDGARHHGFDKWDQGAQLALCSEGLQDQRGAGGLSGG